VTISTAEDVFVPGGEKRTYGRNLARTAIVRGGKSRAGFPRAPARVTRSRPLTSLERLAQSRGFGDRTRTLINTPRIAS
jgi:hypothetical protein